MKIKAIIAICKKDKNVVLLDDGEKQWLGNSQAIYPLFEAPVFDKESLCATYDINDKQQEGIYFINSLPAVRFNFGNEDDTESETQNDAIGVTFGGKSLKPIHTEQGIMFLNERYLLPVQDMDGIEIRLRYTNDGRAYFVLKYGFINCGIVMPEKVITAQFAEEMKKLAYEIELNVKNDTE